MGKHKILLLICSLFFLTFQAEAAVQKQTEQQKLLEELTGKKVAPPVAAQKAAPVVDKRPITRKLLDAGFHAFTKKDYIGALKYYNTIIVKYPKSNELHLAYLAKSKLYSEMGLIDQARLNLQIANEIGKKTQTK
ncbi:MAG: hypothetical protein K0R29_1519 [Pseudobdellovibrio sp.]|jgi:tetratricopeptide (TPR) repeat protein|nr:hypothetical protein [Pseudobdellovibrio sp.]